MSIRRAAIWSLAAQYATFVIQFAVSVIISRFFLLPADVGLFSIALASALMVAIFQDLGITRFVSGQPQMRAEAVPDYAFVAIAIGWFIAALVAVAAPFVADFYDQPPLARLLWVIAVSYTISPFAIVPAAMLTRALDFRALFLVNAGSALVGNGTALGLAAAGFGPAALAWGLLASALMRAVIANIMRPVLPRRPRLMATVRPMLGFSSYSFVLGASNAVGQRSQDLIVGQLLGIAATGLFSRAGALAGQLSVLLVGAISQVFYPAFARKRDAGEPLAQPYLHLVACNTALTWPAMIGLALAAEPLVLLLYGENWSATAVPLRWMALGEILITALPLQMDVPLLLGRIGRLIRLNLLDTAAAVTILSIGCLYGLEAAAIARVVYGVVWWAIYGTYISGLLDFPIRSIALVYLRSGAAALAAGVPLFIAGLMGDGTPLSFGGLVLLTLAGIGLWLATLALLRHPAWGEVKLAVATAIRPLAARAAGKA